MCPLYIIDLMFEENKNLKDSSHEIVISNNQNNSFTVSFSMSYNKTNKLVTALYMVTDIMDKNEPIRLKLRTLGAEVISDIYSPKDILINRISTIISLLDIAMSINLISQMNFVILEKEFTKFKDFVNQQNTIKSPQWIDSFMEDLNKEENFSEEQKVENVSGSGKGFLEGFGKVKSPKGHFTIQGPFMPVSKTAPVARIGVQKGANLMQAISDKVSSVQNKNKNFDNIKHKRQEEILKIIRDVSVVSGGATISDIKAKASGTLASCGEKTLQRELVLLVQNGVLKKTGEKRWSKYSLTK